MSALDLIIRRDEEDREAAEILVDGTIGANAYRFVLDTGSARTCVVFDDYTSTFDCVGEHSSSGVFAKSGSHDLITAPSIEIGPISKKGFVVVRVKETGSGRGNLIGMDILNEYCCHFLFDEHRVLLIRPTGPNPTTSFETCSMTKRSIPMLTSSSEIREPGRYGIPEQE